MNTISPRLSQAHCQVARAAALPKHAKEHTCPNARDDRKRARNANNKYT